LELGRLEEGRELLRIKNLGVTLGSWLFEL